MKNKILIFFVVLLNIILIGCNRKTVNKDNNILLNDNTKTRTIYIAHTQTYVPYVYVNNEGNSDGFEVAVWKEINKLYPKYQIKFIPTSDEDLLIGVQTGKYNVGIKGAWSTVERRQKYLFPKNFIGASVIGLTFRSEDKDKIYDLESFAKFSGKLVPISPQSAQFSIITDFNNSHPDSKINLIPSDVFNIPESYTWVLEKRYDGFLDLQVAYNRNVLASDGAYHQFMTQLDYFVYKAIPTWPLFNKSEVELATDFDNAINVLHNNGKYKELELKYFGEDVSKYVDKY